MPLIQKRAKMNDFLVCRHESRTKPSISSCVRASLVQSHSNKGWHYKGVGRDENIYVYHAEKVRPKFKTETKIVRKKEKKIVTKVRDGGWKMRVFAFPADRVKSVNQHARHFEIVLK